MSFVYATRADESMVPNAMILLLWPLCARMWLRVGSVGAFLGNQLEMLGKVSSVIRNI
jgi:hypothetical protein